MEFEDTLQRALKTLNTSLEQHKTQKDGYQRSINRLTELQKSVPPESKVMPVNSKTNSFSSL